MGKNIKITETQYQDLVKRAIDIEPTNSKIEAIYESSWSRVLKWIEDYDIATITAFRHTLKDTTDRTFIPNNEEIGDTFSLSENRERNKLLKARLLSLGYGVMAIHGSYIEGANGADAIEVSEESFFVVNLKNDTNFYKNLFILAEYFNQDSFLYKAKDEKDAYLIGTNNADYPEYGNKVITGSLTSLPSKFMSRIKNSAIAFVNKDKPTFQNRKKIRQMYEDWIMLYKKNGVILETIDDFSMGGKQAIFNESSKISL